MTNSNRSQFGNFAVNTYTMKYLLGYSSLITELLFVERYHNKPIITKHPENATVVVGTNATFHCGFLSDLHPHITWYSYKIGNNTDLHPRVSICVSFFLENCIVPVRFTI